MYSYEEFPEQGLQLRDEFWIERTKRVIQNEAPKLEKTSFE